MAQTAFLHRALPPTLQRPRRARPVCATQPPQPPLLATLETLSERTQSIKCPFWRRRFSDSLDAVRQVALWALLTRHKSLPLPLPIQPSTQPKTPNLSLENRLAIITEDYVKRQYYVTGRLTSAIYRDDCLFDGPDPDVPVRGLAKYTAATAGLFDRRVSRVDLIRIWTEAHDKVCAEWRLEGALNLPWKPSIKPYTGVTTYQFDHEGLVVSHVETWSVSALDAFISVIWKGFGAPPVPNVEEILNARDVEHLHRDGKARETTAPARAGTGSGREL